MPDLDLDELELVFGEVRGYDGLVGLWKIRDQFPAIIARLKRAERVEAEWERLIWKGLESWQFATYPELSAIARTVRSDPDAVRGAVPAVEPPVRRFVPPLPAISQEDWDDYYANPAWNPVWLLGGETGDD